MKKAKPLPYAIAHHACGFTLIELMVTVAMLAILASLAAPSFADAIRRQRVESMREEMLASIALANAGEPILHVVQGKPGTRILRNPAAGVAAIDRFGQPAQPARIEIFPAGAGFTAANGLLLCVANSGRVRTDRGSTAC
jgi:prepilin-type N-terminal cleavage/methylation domain-containing protein